MAVRNVTVIRYHRAMVQVFTHARCHQHDPPMGYPETPARLESILGGLETGPWDVVERCVEREIAESVVTTVHDPLYLARFELAVQSGAPLLDTGDNPLVADTWDAAWAAVEVTLAAADWMMAASGRKPFAAVRPPGHHAEQSMAMGFCYFNNIALAAEYLRSHHHLARVAVVDFDVHHGNGTQHLFERRADVFYVSLHQSPFYPGTGAAAERGIGAGEGTTLNLPLPPGTGDATYREALEGRVVPALREFSPEALLVSAGFDAWRLDPVGGMAVSRDAYREWGGLIAAVANEICDGRVLSLLEGGYDLVALPGLVRAYLSGLDGAVES